MGGSRLFVNIALQCRRAGQTFVIGTFGVYPATFDCIGSGLDSVVMAAKNEYAACVALKGAGVCKMKIHASSLLTRELILALLLLGLVALIPVVMKRWRKSHAPAK